MHVRDQYEEALLRRHATLRRAIRGEDGGISIVAKSGYPDTFEVWLEWDGKKRKLCSLRLMKNGWECKAEPMLLLALIQEPDSMELMADLTGQLQKGAEREAREHGLDLTTAAGIAADHLAEDTKAYRK